MRLTAIRHYVPQRVVSREETLDLFRHYSKSYYADKAKLDQVLAIVDKLFTYGQLHRYMVRATGEPIYRNFIEMTRQMIDDSGIGKNDIGTVIYCGVSRGYMDPCMASRMAADLGLRKAQFFDILDACNGFSRASRVAYSLLRSDTVGHILVLSLELGRSPLIKSSPDKGFGNYHCSYSIRNLEELEWRAWGATIGEAGIAALFSKENSLEWYFDYDCECDEYSYCSITLRNHRDYDLVPMVLDHVHGGEEFFYALATRIGESVKHRLPPLLFKAGTYLDETSVIVAHSISSAIYEDVFRRVGVHQIAVYPYREYGNIVSCGVPAGIVMAIRNGSLKRGDRAILAPVGSGLSAGVVSFIY